MALCRGGGPLAVERGCACGEDQLRKRRWKRTSASLGLTLEASLRFQPRRPAEELDARCDGGTRRPLGREWLSWPLRLGWGSVTGGAVRRDEGPPQVGRDGTLSYRPTPTSEKGAEVPVPLPELMARS